MFHWNEEISSLRIFHSLDSRNAVGIHHMQIQPKGGEKEIWTFLQYNRLFKRWNHRDYQSNIYAGIGIGNEYKQRDRLAFFSFLKMDYETRTFFVGSRSAILTSEETTHFSQSAQIGFVPYKANPNKAIFWLMLEYQILSNTGEGGEIIPKIRFFNEEIFIELGVSHKGNLHFLLMRHF